MDNSISDSEGDSSERNTIAEETIIRNIGDVSVDKDDSGELIADEKMEQGTVGWRVALIYAKAASYRNALLCILLFGLSQACHLSTNFWLRYWISDSEARERDGQESRPISFYLIGYARLVLLFMCLDVIVNYTIEVICGIRASKVIYDRLLSRVLRLPMSFFDVTPMGRIVNRFSSDVYAIDNQLPEEWNNLFACTAIISGTLFVIAYSTPVFLFAIPPLILVYFWIQHYFIKSSSSLKRLYSVSKSPLYQHFSETLTGVSTIRVMKGLRERVVHENDERADVIANRLDVWSCDNRWLQIRLESLGAIVVFIASSLAVFNAGKLDPSLVGLALSYALNVIGFISYQVRNVNEVQNILVSMERVEEYSQRPTEAPVETGARLPENWPSEGRIVFKNYSTRYREGLDLVIKNVSVTVEPTESVGIVERTGAGKSSLTLALFRIIEAADSYWARASDPTYAEKHPLDGTLALYSEERNGSDGGSIEID
ncbi:Canalicular multispecific organic anion transporter 1, partial [Dissophora globulifera]